MSQENIHKAIAGGEENNCLLNCIAHSLFSLPEAQLNRISQLPAFDALMEIFKNYYKLSVKPTLPMLLAIHKRLDSPYDIEVIWGPVFREFLLRHPKTNDDDLEIIYRNGSIPDAVGVILANELGASLIVRHQFESVQPPFEYRIKNPEFEVMVYHSARGGGHYDFVYPNDLKGEKAKKHNEALLGHSIIYNDNKGIYDRDERKKRVAARLQGELSAFLGEEMKEDKSSYSQRPR